MSLGDPGEPIVFRTPYHLKSSANVRLVNSRAAAMATAAQRRKQHEIGRQRTAWALRFAGRRAFELIPCHVVLVRVSAGCLDDDNLAYAFKYIRDGVAEALGVDDGSQAITFEYRQQLGKRGEHAILIGLERKATQPA